MPYSIFSVWKQAFFVKHNLPHLQLLVVFKWLTAELGSGKISDGVGRATEDIITGVSTAEEAMDAFAQAMTDALGEDMVMRVG
jgi:ABC-type glycerol-3-phosphate transport system substrate-binding protein